MKMLALIAAAALAVTACAPVTEEEVSDAPEVDTGPAVSLGRIRDEAAFLSLVAGQELVGQGGSLRINADGTYSGTDAGLPVSGTWEWRAPVWCAAPVAAEAECFAWDRIPAGIRRIRNQGMGGGTDYRIQ
ncbi:hypothetical protein PARPLA_02451 [Rhodobacteraceae bacterium THAF1]|uniref:hypothetical protein n=1 Tax=Palleronia sp. THAF1 TaxID=2587842 RepID=UPI000F3E7DD9|nr:hypothetical protein [Palleronia sp. THAF1]QFU09261.1 hypothetical protein FIU81_11305 [Palleronia sp. THAF1]VDC27390.1 hypothetical protein PARPLA_02451 [Rhodobacteraceae bacterium THAF1]